MSIGGSEKEFILSMFLMTHKEVLEKVLGFELDQIVLEMPHGRSKVDMLGVDGDRRVEVFIENQITPSDRSHLMEKILPRIDDICEGCIIWIACSFSEEHLVIVKQHIQRSRHKYINFYAIEFSQHMLEQIEMLNSLYKLEIVPNLSLINEIQNSPLSLVYKYEQIPKTHVGKAFVGKRLLNLERSEDVNEYMLEQLRVSLPEFINLFKEKKQNKHNMIVSLGAGRSDVSYRVSAGRSDRLAFAELFFASNQSDLYEWFKRKGKEIKELVHNNIIIDNRRIGVYFRRDADLDVTISHIGEILSKMLLYFSPFLYGRKEVDLQSDDEEELARLAIREFLRLPGVNPYIAELMLEEVDDERALQANEEKIADYLLWS